MNPETITLILLSVSNVVWIVAYAIMKNQRNQWEDMYYASRIYDQSFPRTEQNTPMPPIESTQFGRFTKTTVGYVIQTYGYDGQCIEQDFIAGDNVEFDMPDDCPIEEGDEAYFPFLMKQP